MYWSLISQKLKENITKLFSVSLLEWLRLFSIIVNKSSKYKRALVQASRGDLVRAPRTR